MNKQISIALCKNGHYFLKMQGKCPFCESPSIKEIPYREGDCIFCGWDGLMCPGHAYGCNTPTPINSLELNQSHSNK
jgi:hypothetical protein